VAGTHVGDRELRSCSTAREARHPAVEAHGRESGLETEMGEEEASFGAGYERKVVCMALMRSPSRLR
jgi:hypothetical protein